MRDLQMSAQQLSRPALLWQLLSVFVVVLPHLTHLPFWVLGLVGFTILWRAMVFAGRWSFPSRWLKAALVVAAGFGVVLSFQTGGGISSTVTLLVVAFSLKLLEIYKRRDALVVIYVGYLVAAASFLFDQTLLMGLYAFISIVVLTTALLAIHITRPLSFLQLFKRTSLLFIPALPLMVVLFIAMPRIEPLWNIGFNKNAAKTGLSDSMAPGDITQLTKSAEVAFRATFDGLKPEQSSLYWRAIVLHDFDGRTWNNSFPSAVNKDLVSRHGVHSGTIKYELILEPTQATYVPALDYVTETSDKLVAGRVIQTIRPLAQRKQYRMQAEPSLEIGKNLSYQSLQRELYLPQGNDRARKLAQLWRQQTQTDEQFIAKIMAYFNRKFIYTLSPPPLGRSSVDEFLFDSQRGFCGHFSSATAFMLRAAGIPARIVTGYQGGEWNPYENYLLVRQYDAHAWVEAWLPDKGWIRLDPTAAVAPERIEESSTEILSKEPEFLDESPVQGLGIKADGFLADLRLRIEAINYEWHRWVLHYHHRQTDLLRDLLGGFSIWKLVLFVSLPFVLVISMTMLLMLRKTQGVKLEPFDREIARLSTALTEKGLQRAKGETIRNYCARLADVRPDAASSLRLLASQYEVHKYAVKATGISETEFTKNIDLCLSAFR